jgi:hypothetical protein
MARKSFCLRQILREAAVCSLFAFAIPPAGVGDIKKCCQTQQRFRRLRKSLAASEPQGIHVLVTCAILEPIITIV